MDFCIGLADWYFADATKHADLGKMVPAIGVRQARDCVAETLDALRETETYFADRADAESFTDSPSPYGNEEMRLLCIVRSALARAGDET